MARAIHFPEADDVQRSVSGRYGDLPVKLIPSKDAAAQSLSCWELSPEERDEILRTGRVWVLTTLIRREMFEGFPEGESMQVPLLVIGQKGAALRG